MNAKNYFWWMNEKAAQEAEEVIRDPAHPLFINHIFNVLSRNDHPKEIFCLISMEQFIEQWPKIRNYWNKKATSPDFKAWWETVYEQAVTKGRKTTEDKNYGKDIKKIAETIRNVRIEKGWNQSDFARRVGMTQPDISLLEKGKKNMTIQSLIRIWRTLEINHINL